MERPGSSETISTTPMTPMMMRKQQTACVSGPAAPVIAAEAPTPAVAAEAAPAGPPQTEPAAKVLESANPGAIDEDTTLYQAGWRSKKDIRAQKYYYYYKDGTRQAWKLPLAARRIKQERIEGFEKGVMHAVTSVHGGALCGPGHDALAYSLGLCPEPLALEAADSDAANSAKIVPRPQMTCATAEQEAGLVPVEAPDEWREEWKPIADWLIGLGLEELVWNFIDADYLDPEAIVETGLTESDWRYLHIGHPVHRMILKANKRAAFEYDKYGNPYFVEETLPSALAIENLAILQSGGSSADFFFAGKPDFVPCSEFCGAREGYFFSTRFHKKLRSREVEWGDLDDKGMPKKNEIYVNEKLLAHLESGLVSGYRAADRERSAECTEKETTAECTERGEGASWSRVLSEWLMHSYYRDIPQKVLSPEDAKASSEIAMDKDTLRQTMVSMPVHLDERLHKYTRKKLKVFMQYESWKPGVLPEHKTMRSAIKVSEKWLNISVQELLGHYVKAYNTKHPDVKLDPAECRLAVKDKSYLKYSKKVVPALSLVGDCFYNEHEVFVVTEIDRNQQEVAIKQMCDDLESEYAKVQNNITITREFARTLQTVSRGDEVDEYKAYALLIGLGTAYAVEVQPDWTMADIKLFVSAKSGMPLDAIDLATTSQHKEIENDIDVSLLTDEETCEQLSRRLNNRTITGPGVKAGIPINFGIRVNDPVYNIRIPTVHAPGSFMGEQEARPQADADGNIAI